MWLFGVVFYATNVINRPGTFLAITGVLTNTWVLIILSDYFICRRWLKLGRTDNIEYREGEVREWNPCGLTSLAVAVFVGALGILEVYPVAYASFLAMVVGPIIHVAMTLATKGRFYTPVPRDAGTRDEKSDGIPRSLICKAGASPEVSGTRRGRGVEGQGRGM